MITRSRVSLQPCFPSETRLDFWDRGWGSPLLPFRATFTWRRYRGSIYILVCVSSNVTAEHLAVITLLFVWRFLVVVPHGIVEDTGRDPRRSIFMTFGDGLSVFREVIASDDVEGCWEFEYLLSPVQESVTESVTGPNTASGCATCP